MKGILFKPNMIKAVVDLRKTVTRRVIKDCVIQYGDGTIKTTSKPRYQVGDVVYIKEAWAPVAHFIGTNSARVEYKFDGQQLDKTCDYDKYIKWFKGGHLDSEWKSPLFMPAWAARYFIEITGVRAEKLNTITDEDVKAEGTPDVLNNTWPTIADYHPQQAYCHLWNTINKDHPWETNPWVWRYEFKLVAQPEGI